ncbi:MAG: phenylacetate--CoA ligase family protein, partial [Clostridia bacterium]|nr:phenylacetate--CoA ligase family protein [Clostridia bacterium]
MDKLQKIYDSSPIFFQNIMCTMSGMRKNKARYRDNYLRERAFCAEFDTWPLEKQLEYQREELVKFVKFAYNNSKFYHELYNDCDIEHFSSVEDLKRLPIVDKEMLRANIEDASTVTAATGGMASNTGGTSGKSLTVFRTIDDANARMAMLDHFKSRLGFENLKMKKATFNGKHIIPPNQKKHVYWRYNAVSKQMIYSSFFLTEDKIGYYVDSLNKFKPQAIDGFFTSICDVASYVERHGISLTFKPIAIFPTSETLTDSGRELIERVFGCKVYDQYASSEGAPFVTECKNQTLHIDLNTGVFEILDNNEILVTAFHTHGTPLIRYAIGDKMIPADEGATCSCGLHGTIIKRIQGRRLDFLYSSTGARINAGNVSNL